MNGRLVLRTVAHLAGLCRPPRWRRPGDLEFCWWSPAACLTVISVEKRVFIRVLITYVYSACQGFYYIYFGAFLIHMNTRTQAFFSEVYIFYLFVCRLEICALLMAVRVLSISFTHESNITQLLRVRMFFFFWLYLSKPYLRMWMSLDEGPAIGTYCCVCIQLLFSLEPNCLLSLLAFPKFYAELRHWDGFCTFKEVCCDFIAANCGLFIY